MGDIEMRLNPIGKNMTQLECVGNLILFSYQTPVAMLHRTGQAFKTNKRWSATTTRHINKWLANKKEVIEVPQEFFDNLIKEVK
jgi:hypothetical protein